MKKPRYFPSLEDFVKSAAPRRIVPVYREILADTLTPVSAFMRIDDQKEAFLLESVEGGEKWGRYSFLGIKPRAIIKSKGARVEIVENGETAVKEGDPIGIIKDYMAGFTHVEVEGAPKFFGGAIGYIGYDAIRYIERLPEMAEDDLSIPEIYLIITDTLLVFDNVEHKIKVVSNAFVPQGADPAAVYKEATDKIDVMVELLRACTHDGVEMGSGENGSAETDFTSNFAKEDFLKAVERTKEYIREGDVIQTVISQRFETALDGLLPLDIYRALRVINPSPYMFFLRLGESTIVGSSPEILVAREGTEVKVRPIAGTRPRGATDAEDLALEEELLKDPKERAEHIMLVDLGRNDIGRVAATASVEVDELMCVERYSHVMHIVSNVKAVLKEGLDSFDVLRACFPAGTLTGAPKVRAMEIIEELEPVRRSVYGGSIGYISFTGDMDMAITIRTILINDNRIFVQAGAGIVADSDPETEFTETVNKAKGMLKAVSMARGGLK